MIDELLIANNLIKYYTSGSAWSAKKQRPVKALDGVSFTVNRGETFGIVGESGCGKTTLGKCVVRLHEPDEGKLYFNDGNDTRNILMLDRKEGFSVRRRIQMVFQDPYGSLNPRLNILQAFDEPMRIHGLGDKAQRRETVARMLQAVNMPAESMYRYPHEFSGGQRQRICIAKALAMEPDLVVCDEPVSALDVSIQAQILNLMKNLQKELGLSYIFITHDLSVVQYMSDAIAVMYLGKIVEQASAEALYTDQLHPYTQALLSAVPLPVYGQKKERIILKGDVPSPIDPPGGCRFHPRCAYCMEVCRHVEPELKEVPPGSGHKVACHLVHDPGKSQHATPKKKKATQTT